MDLVKLKQITAVLLPCLSVGARRLHDRNLSGWLQLLYLLPCLGAIILLILYILPGDPEEKNIKAQAVNNKYSQKLQQLNNEQSLNKMAEQLRAQGEGFTASAFVSSSLTGSR